MIFFKEVKKEITAQDILNDERMCRVIPIAYFSDVILDNGEFVRGTTALVQTCDYYDIAECETDKVEILKKMILSNIQLGFYGDDVAISYITKMFDEVYNSATLTMHDELNESPEESSTNVDKIEQQDSEEFWKAFGFSFDTCVYAEENTEQKLCWDIANKFREKMEELHDAELNILTFSNAYKYSVYTDRYAKNENTAAIKGVYNADDCYIKIIVEGQWTARAKFESENIDSDQRMWVRRLYANVMMNNIFDIHGEQYSVFKNYMFQASCLLQTNTVTPEDFHDNPMHHMLGRCYDPNEISRRVGTELVEHVQQFGFCLSHDKIFNACKELKLIESFSSEIGNIKDGKLLDFTRRVIEKISNNKDILYGIARCLDRMLLQEVRSRYELHYRT